MERNSKKPGVVIYFTTREAIRDMTLEQKGRLLDAMLEYADPDRRTVPEFMKAEVPRQEDELLRMAWGFLFPVMDRDDEKYKEVSVSRRYAQFCGVLKQKGIPKIIREDWEAMGCPTYKQWIQTPAYAHMCPHMRAYVDTCAQDLEKEKEVSLLGKEQEHEEREGTPQASPAHSLPPPLLASLRKWEKHREELDRPVRETAERNLAEKFLRYAEQYGVEGVKAFVDVCIDSGWKILPWDRLERESEQFMSLEDRIHAATESYLMEGKQGMRDPSSEEMRRRLDEMKQTGAFGYRFGSGKDGDMNPKDEA